MVLGEALDVVLKGVEARGRDDAGLAHGAAEDLARPSRPVDERRVSEQHGSGGRSEALRQARGHGVEAAAQRLDAGPELHRRVEDTGAVEMRLQSAAPGEVERL